MGPTSGRQRPTIEDVVCLVGASRGAVSIALNGHAGVADATRARISYVALAAHVRPALTTVREDATDRGRAAARSLVVLVEDEALPAVTLTPVIFVERASTSAPRVH